MRRFIVLLIVACGLALGQSSHSAESAGEHESVAEAAQEAAEAENLRYTGWKWANFAILVIVLGYLVRKTAPEFFRARSEGIQRDISEAQRLKNDAENRLARIEMRMASLTSEIQQIRKEAQAEMSKERDRILKDTDQHIARVQAQAEQEIAALSKQATLALKAQAAELAVSLAAERVRSRMSEPAETRLVDRFVRSLDRYVDGRRARV